MTGWSGPTVDLSPGFSSESDSGSIGRQFFVSLVPAIGWLAALCSASIAAPQGFRFFRSGSSAGVSLLIWQTTLVASLGWTVHGLLAGVAQIAVPNAILAVTCVGVLLQLQRMRSLPAGRVWSLPGIWAIAAALADLAFGSIVFAAMVFVPTAIGLVSQWREIARDQDVEGVSLAGIALNLTCQGLWLVYAVPSREMAVIAVATPVEILILGNLVTLLVRRRRPGRDIDELALATG